MRNNDKLRMVEWILLAIALYVSAMLVSNPQLQTGLWKAGHITSGAFIGYWIDRQLLGRVVGDVTQGRIIARAVVVAAAVWGMACGL